jgi:hypothetical protein
MLQEKGEGRKEGRIRVKKGIRRREVRADHEVVQIDAGEGKGGKGGKGGNEGRVREIKGGRREEGTKRGRKKIDEPKGRKNQKKEGRQGASP